jgi:hypothetical protein
VDLAAIRARLRNARLDYALSVGDDADAALFRDLAALLALCEQQQREIAGAGMRRARDDDAGRAVRRRLPLR